MNKMICIALFFLVNIFLNYSYSQTFIPFGFWSGEPPKNYTWDATPSNSQVDNGSGTWTAASNNFTLDNGASNVAFLNNSTPVFGGTGTLGAAGVITVSGAMNVYNMSFYSTPSGNFTLNSGTLNFTKPNLFITGGFSPTISSVISGNGGLIVKGGGSLILTGLNTYTGGTTIYPSTTVQSGATAGTSTTAYIPAGNISNNGTLNFILSSASGLAFPNFYSYSGTGNLSITAGLIRYTGNIITGGSFVHNQTGITNLGCSTVSSTITASTAVITGPIYFGSVNTNTFKVDTSSTNGTQTINNVSFGIPGQCWSFNNNLFEAGMGIISITGSNVWNWWSAGATLTLNGQVTGSGNIAFGSNAVGTGTLSFNNPGNSTYTGVLSGSNYKVVFGGTGTQVLSGANTYSGGTEVKSGTVISTVATGLGTGSVSVSGGATFYFSGGLKPANNFTTVAGVGASKIGANTAGTFTEPSGNIVLNNDLILYDGTGDRLSFNGVISGNGNITITGTRVTIANSANSFIGTVTISPGSALQANGLNILNSNDLVNNGSFRFNTGSATNVTIGALSGNGTFNFAVGSSATLTVGANNNSGNFNGTFTSGIKLIKSGTGNQRLSGASTYTGGTQINAGTITCGSSTCFGTGAVTCGASCTLGSPCTIAKNGFTPTNSFPGSTPACTVTP